MASGAASISESTLAYNGAVGADIYNGENNGLNAAAVNLTATVLAGDGGGNGNRDCGGGVTADGYNIDDDGSCSLSAVNSSQSDVPADLGPLQNNGGPTETQAPGFGSPALNRIPVGTTENGMTLCPGTDQRGVSRPQGSECDIGAVEVAIPQAITTPNNAIAYAHSSFSFTIETSGSPIPVITEKGALPKKLTFVDLRHGAAIIFGKPKTAGIYNLTIKATFGSGSSKYVVVQKFTLTVDSS